MLALHDVLKRAELFSGHAIKRGTGVRQHGRYWDAWKTQFYRFEGLFTAEEGKLGVLVTFLAVELARNSCWTSSGRTAGADLREVAGRWKHQRAAAFSNEFDDCDAANANE